MFEEVNQSAISTSQLQVSPRRARAKTTLNSSPAKSVTKSPSKKVLESSGSSKKISKIVSSHHYESNGLIDEKVELEHLRILV